jgi:hypothetical protein
LADEDDDDGNGTADGLQGRLTAAASVDARPIDESMVGAIVKREEGDGQVRFLARGMPVSSDKPLPPGASVQGLKPGTVKLTLERAGASALREFSVASLRFRDGAGQELSGALSHASLSRTPPRRTPAEGSAPYDDPDALRVVVQWPRPPQGPGKPPRLDVESLSTAGRSVDELRDVALAAIPCEGAVDSSLQCFSSAPLHFVGDDVDREHPLFLGKALRADLGGAIVARLNGRKAQALRVLGPRISSAGPIARLRAKVRPIVLRVAPSGAPAVGGSDMGAVAAMRSELSLAASVWAQCGVSLGDIRTLDIRIVDPPAPFLVAIGDDLGFSSSGGELRLKVDGRPLNLTIARGRTPDAVAYQLASALDKAGFVPTVSPNARIGPGVTGSVDVLVRRRNGTMATVEPVSGNGEVCTDATLSVRIGMVDLNDGLQHFRDADAVAGTLEERTLLKAIDDGDPQTIELVVVPSFSGGVRIGESFIGMDGSSLRNVVIVDRAGVRARRSSLTLAHELGHVLLDLPDHPDDYGVDTPTRLMDSDASDPSAFGPRRITEEECARVMRESGPLARTPLLTAWPTTPVPIEPVRGEAWLKGASVQAARGAKR